MSFETAYAVAKERGILLDEDRAKGLYDCANECSILSGEYWECGVYKGGSAKIIADVLDGRKTFRLFDTFAGLRGIDKSIDTKSCIHDGWLTYSDVEDVRRFIGYPQLPIHVGRIPQTFKDVLASYDKIAFAHIDVDLYQPTRDALLEVLPHMNFGGIIVVDDYLDPEWPGVQKAVGEAAHFAAFLYGAVRLDTQGTQLRIRL